MVRTFVRGVGQTLLTCGLILMLFACYEVYGKTWQVIAERKKLSASLERSWGDTRSLAELGTDEAYPSVAEGEPLVKLTSPELNLTWVVVQGVSTSDIARAPGHYPTTALPGQVGNFAVAGHRSPELFWDLDRLEKGSYLVVESAQRYYVYTVYETRVVSPSDYWVVAPDPDHQEAAPTRRLLTLTTCNPKWDNYQRLIIHAELTGESLKSDGPPDELG
jgi:sortase A